MGYACYILSMGDIRKTTLIVKVVKSEKWIELCCYVSVRFHFYIGSLR